MKTCYVYGDQQILECFEGDARVGQYSVSTGAKGFGEVYGSEQTPRGWHMIRAKIGEGQPVNTVFIKRRPTGEIYSEALAQAHPGRDWILTRILWLSGLELNKNRLGNVDTMRRYIYIHGTPDSTPLGKPGSRGCIRMNNQDLVEFFSWADIGTRILVQ